MGKVTFQFNQPKERVMNACVFAMNSMKWPCVSEMEYGRIATNCTVKPYKTVFCSKADYRLLCTFIARVDNGTEMIVDAECTSAVTDLGSTYKRVASMLYEKMEEVLVHSYR